MFEALHDVDHEKKEKTEVKSWVQPCTKEQNQKSFLLAPMQI